MYKLSYFSFFLSFFYFLLFFIKRREVKIERAEREREEIWGLGHKFLYPTMQCYDDKLSYFYEYLVCKSFMSFMGSKPKWVAEGEGGGAWLYLQKDVHEMSLA